MQTGCNPLAKALALVEFTLNQPGDRPGKRDLRYILILERTFSSLKFADFCYIYATYERSKRSMNYLLTAILLGVYILDL